MPRGGHRPNAGRKTNTERDTIRTVLERCITSEQWEFLARDLYKLARNGNVRAAELLILCRFGGPNPDPAPEDVEQIQIIEYRPMEPRPETLIDQ